MKYIGINIIGITLDIFVILLALFNSYMSKKKKKCFVVSSIIFLTISITAIIQSLLRDNISFAAIPVLNISQALIFSTTPLCPLLLVSSHIIMTKKKLLLGVPFIVNIVFCFISIFTVCVFHFDLNAPDNYFYGPFYFVPIIISVYSLLLAIFIAVKSMRYQSMYELFFMIGIFVLSGASFGLEFLTETNYLFYNMASVGVIGYFAMVSILDIRKDPLSNVYNRAYFDTYISEINGQKNAVILMYDLNDLKKTNDLYGHSYGDKMISTIGKCLLSVYNSAGSVFRYGGDEFFVFITDERRFSDVNRLKIKAQKALAKESLSAALGQIIYNKKEDIYTSIETVDKLMYDNKKEMKKNRL